MKLVGPEVGPDKPFLVKGGRRSDTTRSWLGERDPAGGWSLLVENWVSSGGEIQFVTKPFTGQYDDMTEVVVDLNVFFEARRMRAAWFSGLNLIEVLLRTTGFYASSYAAFAAAHGYPNTVDLATEAGALWTALRNSTNDAAAIARAGDGHDAGNIIQGVVGALSVIPIAGQMIAVAYAVVVGVTELLIAIGGAAVGHGVYAVQPLFVRQFIGDCATNTLVSAAGAAVDVQERILVSREAVLESNDEHHNNDEARAVPWFEIGLGAAAALGLALGLKAVFGK